MYVTVQIQSYKITDSVFEVNHRLSAVIGISITKPSLRQKKLADEYTGQLQKLYLCHAIAISVSSTDH